MMVHVALRGVEFSGASDWPVPEGSDSGNEWKTGRCWLYCRREDVSVLWIGPIRTPYLDGEMYGCGQCVAELVHTVREEQRRADLRLRRLCEHRDLEKREGKTFCTDCHRQIYL
ncbi:hypothetical protein OIE51_14015 [Streptomyces sp. NBC_01803]|nr:hypothetical protein [Streptomyces sp. NBC_01803]WSA45228.1 hypothetical protein OIE51_14015 [Streptomyces sp. NBC_01803]